MTAKFSVFFCQEGKPRVDKVEGGEPVAPSREEEKSEASTPSLKQAFKAEKISLEVALWLSDHQSV